MPAAVLAALLCAGADDPPALRPTRDVDVTYALDAGGGPALHERLRWSVTTRALRLDPPSAGLYVIIDLAARHMSTVRVADRSVIETAAPANLVGVPDSAAGALRQGEDMIAGLACTEWQIKDAVGQATLVCLTQDGVLLRARARGRTLLSAEAVRYGPLDPALFQVPPDYARRSLGTPR